MYLEGNMFLTKSKPKPVSLSPAPYNTHNLNFESEVSSSLTSSTDESSDLSSSSIGRKRLKNASSEGRKRVTFGDVQRYEIENVNALSGQLWYSHIELDIILRNNMVLIETANSKGITYIETRMNNQTIRGLEHLLKNEELSRRRNSFYETAKNAVFCEQLRQTQLETSSRDPKSIKIMYRSNGAKKSQLVASALGLHDEKIAQEIHKFKQDEIGTDEESSFHSFSVASSVGLVVQKDEEIVDIEATKLHKVKQEGKRQKKRFFSLKRIILFSSRRRKF